jgi:hypothetical protein
LISERVFVVDRLVPEFRRAQKKEVWGARTITPEEKRLKIKRAHKKELEVIEFGEENVGGMVIAGREVLLYSMNKEIPVIEIRSEAIAKLHLELIKAGRDAGVVG